MSITHEYLENKCCLFLPRATFVSALSYIADSKNYVSMKVPEQMLNSLIYRPALILRIALNKVLFSKLRKVSLIFFPPLNQLALGLNQSNQPGGFWLPVDTA